MGGAIATNAGGLRVLRYGPMRAQLRGIEAVLSDGTVLSHLAGLAKDNTGYDYPALLAGSEGTLAVITQARLRLVPRARDLVTVLCGLAGPAEVHALARRAADRCPACCRPSSSPRPGWTSWPRGPAWHRRWPARRPGYLLLEAAGPGALDDLAGLAGEYPRGGPGRGRPGPAVGLPGAPPEAAGFLGTPIKLDVAVPAARWAELAAGVAGVVAAADPAAQVITFGHVADGNLHVNIVPAAPADGRHEDAVFSFVASLGGSISAEHGIGALKARWLPLARSAAERALFARIRARVRPGRHAEPARAAALRRTSRCSCHSVCDGPRRAR